MKIDESCVNHNALRLIKNTIEGYSDAITDNDEDTKIWMIDMVSRVAGIIDMADAMKEVIKE